VVKTEKTEKFFKGCRLFGYKFVDGISGQEAVYFEEDSTMITNRIEKVFLLKINKIITSNIDEINGWYKFKVKRLYQPSKKQKELVEKHMKEIMWRYGNTYLQQIKDIEEYISSVEEDEVITVLKKLIDVAKNIEKKISDKSDHLAQYIPSGVFIDVNINNWMVDKRGNLINPDGLWMRLIGEDKHKFKEIFF